MLNRRRFVTKTAASVFTLALAFGLGMPRATRLALRV